jgi:hypothetical protein
VHLVQPVNPAHPFLLMLSYPKMIQSQFKDKIFKSIFRNLISKTSSGAQPYDLRYLVSSATLSSDVKQSFRQQHHAAKLMLGDASLFVPSRGERRAPGLAF